MSGITRIETAAAAIAVALTLTSCATFHTNSYQPRGIDVGQYRTYAWAPSNSFSTGDPRLDNNRFFIERVQTAVNQRLAVRRLEKTEAETASLLIHIHARIDQRIDPKAIDPDFRCEVPDCRTSVFDEGTLLLDFVDTRTRTLAWRGWAEGSLDGAIDDQDWMNAKIDDAVEAILARFPKGVRK